jgi:hypothetical protein
MLNAFFLACENGDIDVVQDVINSGHDLNLRNEVYFGCLLVPYLSLLSRRISFVLWQIIIFH